MKRLLYITFLSMPLFTAWFCTSSATKRERIQLKGLSTTAVDSNKNIAVLELFTSQGCSSCPPADRLLGTYTSRPNVILLSFHVDYWDHLGWKDPFSSKEFTQRQYFYASALHASVYTPQLVINGQAEMIGSDENKLSSVLNKIFSEQPSALLSIKNVNTEAGKINISFDAAGNIANSLLNIALVEKKITTSVKAGENGGVTLTNYNVVRNFKAVKAIENGKNNSSIDIPAASDVKNMSVVIFLQQKRNNKISAADQVTL